MRIESLLAQNALRNPHKTALVTGDRRLSHADLDRFSSRFAAGMTAEGARAGDRIVFLLDNGSEAAIAFFAIWKLGGIACPLHPSIKSEKLAGILASTTPTIILTQAKFLATVETACSIAGPQPTIVVAHAEPGTRRLRYEDMIADDIAFAPPAGLGVDELALLIHTSGSTGRPKGVMLSHGNIAAACTAITGYLNNSEDDIVLSALPLSFGYGITQMVTMAMVGGTLVLERSFAYPRVILSRLQSEAATGFAMVPTMATLFAGMRDLTAEMLPDLRYITNAAAGMPPSITTHLRQTLPHVSLYLMYGQTECLRTTYLPPDEADRRPLSVGRAIAGTRVSIVDKDGKPVMPGQTGELVVEGPHVMRGYWGDELSTIKALHPTASGVRLHSGDLFFEDEDGFLYFVGRRDDMIKTRGEKVSPQEVERVLYALPGIREAAVEGVPDALLGQSIRAHVAVDPATELTERAILRHCALHLEDFMIPRSVEFHENLPRTVTGKIRLGVGDAGGHGTEQGRTG